MRIAVPLDWTQSIVAAGGGKVNGDFTFIEYNTENRAWLDDIDRQSIEVLVTKSNRVGRRCFEGLRDLRLVIVPGTGVYDYVDVDAASDHRVLVSNVRDYATDAIAEFTLGLIIAMARRFHEADRAVRTGEWNSAGLFGFELRGRTLGVVGLGKIGRRVAELSSVFGMEVLASTRYPESLDAAGLEDVSIVSLERLMEQSDVVTVHAALTQESSRLIDAGKIQLMKPGSLFVNTSRAGLVDTTALVEGLRSGRIAMAALDVFDSEPLPVGHVLSGISSVILTPHIAGATREAHSRCLREVSENIMSYSLGLPRNIVNPKVRTEGSR